LEKIIEINPENADALNALGYLLTNQGKDYETAYEYIRQALDLKPDNPPILDSLGWVEFKLGRLESARKHLDAAYEARPEAEIAAHLGELYWQQGERDKAKKVWEEAHQKQPDDEVLNETMERLTAP